MGYLEILKLIVSLAPSIVELVHSVETKIPNSGQGSKKLGMVLGAVNSAIGVAQDVKESAHAVRDGIRGVRAGNLTPENIALINHGVTQIVNDTVKVFNDTGIFPDHSNMD